MDDKIKQLKILTYNPKVSKEQVLNFIKHELTPGQFDAAINSNPLLKRARLKNNWFKNATDVLQRETASFSDNLRIELYWILYELRTGAQTINEFLIEKARFERLFFLGKYENAENYLSAIRGKFGETLWSIEMSLLLKEYKYSTKDNWESLSEYLTMLESPYYQFVVNIYSKRIEDGLSFENFFSQFQNEFDSVRSDKLTKDFLVFKSASNADYEYSDTNLPGVIFISNIFGTIDQYLTLIDILLRLTAGSIINDRLIIGIVDKLLEVIKEDEKLLQIQNVLNGQRDVVILNNTDLLLPVIDAYAQSQFETSLERSAEHLKQFPLTFELLEIYTKSLIQLNRKYQPLEISPWMDAVSEGMYKILSFNSESEKSLNKLLKLSLTFLSFDFGKQLTAFVSAMARDDSQNLQAVIGCLCSTINNPRILTLDLDKRDINRAFSPSGFAQVPSSRS